MKFLTQYKQGDRKFQSYIMAENWDSAELLAKKRGIGERIIGKQEGGIPDFPSFEANPKDVGHWLMFFAYVCLKSGYSPEEVVGDYGFVHEMYHKGSDKYYKVMEELGFL